MTEHRLTRLKQAKKKLQNTLDFDHENMEGPAKELFDLLKEVTMFNPLPATDKQHRLERYVAETYARDMLDMMSLHLHYEGYLEDIYGMIQDPAALSNSILKGMTADPNGEWYKDNLELMQAALKLGGIIAGKSLKSMDYIFSPHEYKSGYVFSDTGAVKKLIQNHMENEWALEIEEHEQRNYQAFLGLLVATVGDVDPQWAVRFVLEHDVRLQSLFKIGPYSVERTDLRPLIGCIALSGTPKMLVELNRQRPDLYEAFMLENFKDVLLDRKLKMFPEFRLSDFPIHESLSEQKLIKLFISCGQSDSLTAPRLEDLNAAWSRFGFTGQLLHEAMESEAFQPLADKISAYHTFLMTEDLTAEQVMASKNKFNGVGKNFTLLDTLVNKLDGVPPSVQYSGNHYAYLLASHGMKDQILESMPIKGITLGTAILVHEQNRRDELLKVIREAFADENHYPEVAKLPKALLDKAMKLIPKFDQSILRQINWVDSSIKAKLISDDMGL